MICCYQVTQFFSLCVFCMGTFVVQTCGRVSERVRVCTGCGAVSHAAVSCHVSVGLFFLECGALCGVASAESHPSLPQGRDVHQCTHRTLCSPPGAHVQMRSRALCTILLLFREFASAECVSLSSRVTRGESSIRLTPVKKAIQHPVTTLGDPASGYSLCLPQTIGSHSISTTG